MQQEVEARFPNVDPEAMRSKLRTLSATCVEPAHAMRRVIIDYPDRKLQIGQKDGWSFVRIRDDGAKITITYKHVAKNENKDTYEIEFEVSSFEKAIELLEVVGLEKQGEQHTRRELWKLDGCDVAIDEWPWIEPMVEIEGRNEAAVRAAADKLGFTWSARVFGNVQDVYNLIFPGIGEHEAISQIPLLTFEGDMPQWLKDRQSK